MRNSIKNIIFDFGGVAVPLTPSVALSRFEQLGVRNARELLGRYGHEGIFRQCEDGSIDADTFGRELGRIVQEQQPETYPCEPPVISFKQCQWAWCGYVTRVDLHRLNYIASLKERYNVILLSNTNPFVVEWAESDVFSGDGHGLRHYFHKVFYSYEMHDYKPSDTIFKKLLQESGINATESFFLDDSAANIEAARREGIDGIVVGEEEDWIERLDKILKERG